MLHSPDLRKIVAHSPQRRRDLALILTVLLAIAVLPSTRASLANRDSSAEGNVKLTGSGFVPGHVLVRFRSGSALADQTNSKPAILPMRANDGHEIPLVLESFEGSKLIDGLRIARVQADDTLSAIEALNARSDVEFAEPDYIWRKTQTPNDPRFGELYGLRNTGQDFGTPDADIDADGAWDVTTGSSNVVVAVIDGGVDVNHEDLRDNIWINPGEVANNSVDDDGNGFVDDVNGWDFHHNDKTVFDGENGDDHATHVAGTIGATGNNGIGVVGVNWQVRIMSLKVLGPTGGSTSNIISGYNYVRMMRQRGINVRVTNNSYGGSNFSQSAFLAIQELHNAGILFVASAGNEASDNFNQPHYPSDYKLPNVISVASMDRFDGLSSFSNFGERVIHLGAPGSQILSTTPNNSYSVFNGTSMATPHVTGTAALVLSVNPNITVQNLRGALIFSGDVRTSLQGKTTTGRRLNALAAINSATESGGAADAIAPENPRNLEVVLVNGRQVTLRWTVPGDDGASGAAADYDFTFLQFGGGRLILPATLFPEAAGTTQTATVTVPYLNQNGTIELRAYDNAGNFGASTVSVFLGQNHLNDPYITATNTGPEALSTGGTPLGLIGDDKYRENFVLPFFFPFYGLARNTLTVSTNGALYFSAPRKRNNGDADDLPSSVQSLQGQTMIAGLWDDLRTDRRPGDDVFVIQDSSHVIFRWQGVTFGNGTPSSERPFNFEIELRNDGSIIFRYGAGQTAPINTDLFSVVGISGGEPDPYIISSHTAGTIPLALTNANVVTFTRRIPFVSSFQFSHAAYSMVEHDRTVGILITRTGDISTLQAVNLKAQGDPPGLMGTGQLIFFPGDTRKIAELQRQDEVVAGTNETFNLRLEAFSPGTTLGAQSTATLTVVDDDVFPANMVQFTSRGMSVSENAGKIDLTVERAALSGGDLSQDAFVSYRTFQSTALDTRDYTFAAGMLHFLPGETSKTLSIFITNDVFDEPVESFVIELSNPLRTTMFDLGNKLLSVEIQDDDPPGVTANPSDISSFFVTQHYMDFLNRLPDAGGLNFWTNEIEQCGADAQCREIKRINVSAAFYLSIEFQETGFLVYRTYKAAFGNMPGAPVPVKIQELLPDTQEIGRGVQVGIGDWENQLEINKQAFFNSFVDRGRFKTALPPEFTPVQFVDALNRNAGFVLEQAERDALVSRLTANNTTAERASILRQVAENATLKHNELNKAFVLMEYFGYLRRNPNAGPDTNFNGWQFWLNKLNQFNGNFVNAEMVKAFIVSIEYRQRFGP